MSSENTKSINTLGGWGTPLGELTLFPRPGSTPSRKPHLAISTSGFQLQSLGPKQLRAPKLLLNQGPSEPCYATVNRRTIITFWMMMMMMRIE